MKKKGKKLVIKDYYGGRVLVETIASYFLANRTIRLFLRSGTDLTLTWVENSDARAMVKKLDELFNIMSYNKKD